MSVEIISKKFNFNFIGKWPIAVTISVLLCAASIWVWFAQGETKYGVDFRGGHEIVVEVTEGGSAEAIRKALEAKGINDAIVQSFEIGSNQYSIRLGGEKVEGTSEVDNAKIVRSNVQGALTEAFSDKFQILKTDYVGPTVGKELRTKALWATIIGLVAILIYMTVRFEFAFALGAVVAILHDVIISTGLYLFAGYQINMGTIAAALTILGYSVHDTIVILDRVREELFKRKDYNFPELLNECINATLSRTIITQVLTLFSVGALLLFGGGAISDLSFYLFAGVICGAYSTIYIAGPVVLVWDYLRMRKHEARTAAEAR